MNEESTQAVSKTHRAYLKRLISARFSGLHGLLGVFVSSADGHGVVSHAEKPVDLSRISAISSALLALSDTLMGELKHEKCQHIAIQTASGPVVLLHILYKKRALVLAAMAHQHTPLGGLLSWTRELAADITKAISEEPH